MKKPTNFAEFLALKNPRAAELHLAHQERLKATAERIAAAQVPPPPPEP